MRPRLVGEATAELLVQRLEGLGPLPGSVRTFIRGLTPRLQEHAAAEELFVEGDLIRTPRLVVSGWGCRMRFLPDGRRQIFKLLLPGDTIGLGERLAPLALCSVVALTPMATVEMSVLASALRSGEPEHDALVDTFALAARAEEASALDHMVRLGRLTAYERVAHLLLDLCHRLEVVGLGDWRFNLPLNQETLGDALGLSLVHVNRTLMQLRRDRLLVLKGSAAELPDFDRLASIVHYAPQTLRPRLFPETARMARR